ncbi:MAG TPA: ABC transporter ATP-binding protein [Thermoflexia bacterium]|jgi:cobalt transport protein ATP-binding subunit|nr:ABC transporter ATP-binding protein [Thermoflexia bacterium]
MELCVDVRNLWFTYPDGREALRGINLSVSPGEKVALVGPNGAGKSTLLLILAGLLRGQGTVRLFGEPLNDGNLKRMRSRIGLVFQDPDDQLFSPTVFDDVAYGPLYAGLPEEEVKRRVSWALAQMGLEGFAERLSHHLSVGEKKRVAVATVLSMQPEILLLDEPTSGLDPRARRRLIGLLAELRQTMLVATHDMRLVAELLPRTVILDGGRVVADGPTEEILADDVLLENHGLERP